LETVQDLPKFQVLLKVWAGIPILEWKMSQLGGVSLSSSKSDQIFLVRKPCSYIQKGRNEGKLMVMWIAG
jgi:hypothetical protein